MSDIEPLRLGASDNTVRIWNVPDVERIRFDHRLCGLLTGTLPHLAQQNVFLGRPLLLMPEEVALLVNKGFAILIDDKVAHSAPSLTALEDWDTARREDIQNKLELAAAKQATSQEGAGNTAQAQRKRKEREAKRALQKAQAQAQAQAAAEGLLFQPEEDEEKVVAPTPLPAPSGPLIASEQKGTGINDLSGNYALTISSSSHSVNWYHPEDANSALDSLSSARDAGVWLYPSTPTERARCAVFEDLWSKGYYLGGGIRFGGEYLVYPGDPLRYHSHFVASVLESPTAPLRPMEIVAHGRLGTGTKKAHLLCGWDEEKKETTYFSIEWAGFG